MARQADLIERSGTASRDEALDRLERRAGPAARKMLERFLDQVNKAEAEYRDQTDVATSFKDAAS